jgi:glutamine amidotransferase
MCRLFGFRSIIQSQVHSSLIEADNALVTQSSRHPDGWGVAYYVDECPQLMRSPAHALSDNLFHRLSGVVSSETVLAHVRKATQGVPSVFNCHPFQYGRWTFAHNGDIPDFSTHREALQQLIAPRLRRFILGETDSETVFYLLLTALEQLGPLNRRCSIDQLIEAARTTVHQVRQICDCFGAPPSLLTFIVTDGACLLATQGGKELFCSTYKRKCPERARCPSYAGVCEAESATGFVNHFIASSEPLQGENVWEELNPGDVWAIDGHMKMTRTQIEQSPRSIRRVPFVLHP